MKWKVLSCLLAAVLLLGGCTGQTNRPQPTEPPTAVPNSAAPTEAPTTGQPETAATIAPTEFVSLTTEAQEIPFPGEVETEPEPNQDGLTENPVFTAVAGAECSPSILAVVYNDPFPDGEPNATQIWREGEYDRLVIYPRWIGSQVQAWQILRAQDEEGEFEYLEGPVYATVCSEATCVAAALDRPEGGSSWALVVNAPDGRTGTLELAYNGRYGTYAYEYLTDNRQSFESEAVNLDPELRDLLTGLIGSEDALAALFREAARTGKDPWDAVNTYCSPLNGYGDAAAYVLSQGEMEGDAYAMEAVLLRESYDPGEGSLAERAAAQAALYAEIGNEGGILGIDREPEGPLYFDLTGLTVFNPTLLAREVAVTVNGVDQGIYPLREGDFVTLLDVTVEKLPADVPVLVEVRVTDRRGTNSAPILEVWPGLSGNISGAR